MTPSGKTYVLWDGADYGKLKQIGNSKRQCAIAVNNAEDVDNGAWKCQITYIKQNGDGVAVSRSVDVKVSSP